MGSATDLRSTVLRLAPDRHIHRRTSAGLPGLVLITKKGRVSHEACNFDRHLAKRINLDLLGSHVAKCGRIAEELTHRQRSKFGFARELSGDVLEASESHRVIEQ